MMSKRSRLGRLRIRLAKLRLGLRTRGHSNASAISTQNKRTQHRFLLPAQHQVPLSAPPHCVDSYFGKYLTRIMKLMKLYIYEVVHANVLEKGTISIKDGVGILNRDK